MSLSITIFACSTVLTIVTPGTLMLDMSKYPSSPALSCAFANSSCSLAGSRPPKCVCHPRGSSGFQFPPGIGLDFIWISFADADADALDLIFLPCSPPPPFESSSSSSDKANFSAGVAVDNNRQLLDPTCLC